MAAGGAWQVFFQLDGATGQISPEGTSTRIVTLSVFGQPFARGNSRNVYWALVDGARFVGKRYMGYEAADSVRLVEHVGVVAHALTSASPPPLLPFSVSSGA